MLVETELRKRGLATYAAEPLVTGLTAEELVRATAQSGPAVLILYGIVPPGDGGKVYNTSHAVLLLGTFEDSSGRKLGILLDGNDLQSNAVMEQIRRWQEETGDKRPLSHLGIDDFEAVNARMRRQNLAMDVLQTAFRVVDLDGMLEAGKAGFAGFDPGRALRPQVLPSLARLDQPAIDASQLEALRAAVERGEIEVEAFTRD